MAGTVRDPVSGESKVPRWLDLLVAIWMITAAAAFVVKVLFDTGLAPASLQTVIIVGRYGYAAMIVGCVIGGGLAVVRRLSRS